MHKMHRIKPQDSFNMLTFVVNLCSVTLTATAEAVDWVWVPQRWRWCYSVVCGSCVYRVSVCETVCHAARHCHWPGNYCGIISVNLLSIPMEWSRDHYQSSICWWIC